MIPAEDAFICRGSLTIGAVFAFVSDSEMEGKTVLRITHHYHDLEGMDRVVRVGSGELLAEETL